MHVSVTALSLFPPPASFSVAVLFQRPINAKRNSSTCGVLSSIIACVQWHSSRPRPPLTDTASGSSTSSARRRRKSVVILPRDAHKSAVHALVLSGAAPCFLPPARHPESGVSLGIGTAALEAALEEHGDQVRLVDPSSLRPPCRNQEKKKSPTPISSDCSRPF